MYKKMTFMKLLINIFPYLLVEFYTEYTHVYYTYYNANIFIFSLCKYVYSTLQLNFVLTL